MHDLQEIQESQGARFAEDSFGQSTAVNYGDPRAEYLVALNEVALFDLTGRSLIQITGEDRKKFLHNFCTNEILKLEPGQGCEAFALNAKGKVLAHFFVFDAEDSIWLNSVPNVQEAIIAHLDRYIITEDVALHDRTSEFGEFFLAGSGAAELLESSNLGVNELLPFASVKGELSGVPIQLHRVDLFGSPGFLMTVESGNLSAVWEELTSRGATPAGWEAFEALRIEAGTPLYGIDISDENLPQEVARNEQAISFTKGCYLGQEPVARIDAMGHVNRELRLLTCESETSLQPGSLVFGEDHEIGRLTSVGVSYRDEHPRTVALGFLRRGFLAHGTEVEAREAGETAKATVSWPFV